MVDTLKLPVPVLIKNQIVQALGPERAATLTLRQQRMFIEPIVRYALKVDDCRVFNTVTLPFLHSSERKRLRHIVCGSYDLMCFRMAIFTLAQKKRLYNSIYYGKCLRSYGLAVEDAVLCSYLRRSGLLINVERMVKKLQNPIPKLAETKHVCNELIVELNAYTRRLVWAKLRHFANANHMSQDDFVNELLAHAARAYYSRKPMLNTRLHEMNAMKAAMQNYAINLISHYTAAKRCRAYQNEDGQTINLIQTDQIVNGEGGGNGGENYTLLRNVEGTIDTRFGDFELLASLDKIRSTMKVRSRTALDLLLQQPNQEFIDYYNGRHATKRSSVEDVLDHAGSVQFRKEIRLFTHLRPRRMHQIVTLVKHHVLGVES